MTAEGYKTFINGSVMASFMEGIVASILEEKSGAGYGTNCSQLNTVISVIEAMYLCEGMWLFPFCAEDRFFNQPSCIYARLSLAERNTPIAQNFVLYSVYFALAGGYHAGYGGGFVNGHLYVHSHWH
ncbi:hypothetical protein DWZ60_02270 [Blautia sp. AF34-10]|nr:hypothetical protein DWZ60_02270 [Blautia sp. AF34-10]